MKDIELVISEGIKNGRWIDISYENSNNEITFYWIAINDINLKSKNLKVTMFNYSKGFNTLNATIKFDNILTAKVLDFTSYDTPIELIKKIEKNREEAKWLRFESFNNNILRYYLKCNELDNDPYQKDSIMIEGLDRNILLKRKYVILNDYQENKLLSFLRKKNIEKQFNQTQYFILSFLSIESNEKKYVILYYDVRFNPATRVLSIDETPRVNPTFLIDGKTHSLSYYIDINPYEFVSNITNNLNKYLKEYTDIIRSNLRDGEIIDQLPEFMLLERSISSYLAPTYNIIQKKNEERKMNTPLKAFFGDVHRYGGRTSNPAIVIYDNKVNVNQMGVIYYSMTYPITYVQGPPGTGKTQTILNVVLSAFFNSKTVLICSSNNKPINGIIEKLTFKDNNNDEIPFPYLRLGNRDEVYKATLRIIELYNYEYKLEPDEKKIERIKKIIQAGNKDLLEKLQQYEKRKDLRLRYNSAKKLLKSINDPSNNLYQTLYNQLFKISNEYESIPKVENKDLLELVNSVSDDNNFKQYMYFESIRYIKKLRMPKYSELIRICSIDNIEERVTEFNKWCSIDDNIKLLEDVFPIIITTNISASRLGTAEHLFNLVIMDEAGQCNCATALIPIARAEKLLLVGDTNQLKPVVVLEENINESLKKEFNISDDYDYCKNSILDIMRNHDSISKDIMLTYHYRCGKKIIDFSNKRFYNNKLNLDYLTSEGNLTLLDVENKNSKYKNENFEEAQAIIDYIKRNNIKDAGIITPFKNQQVLINNLLKENNINDSLCGTIHQVQGAEKDTIIISASISPKTSKKTFDWIKNNSEITNVAVTRAKKNLIVVADVEAIDKLSTDKNDDLYNLVKYVQNKGNYEVPANETYTIQIGSSNGSKHEDAFFKTITQFCSTNKNFHAKRNVKLSTLFKDDKLLKESKLEFDCVLYIKLFDKLVPKIAIELQGGEHFGNYDREKCDARKIRICKEKGISILFIPNSFAKEYESIKEIILEKYSDYKDDLEQLRLF